MVKLKGLRVGVVTAIDTADLDLDGVSYLAVLGGLLRYFFFAVTPVVVAGGPGHVLVSVSHG